MSDQLRSVETKLDLSEFQLPDRISPSAIPTADAFLDAAVATQLTNLQKDFGTLKGDVAAKAPAGQIKIDQLQNMLDLGNAAFAHGLDTQLESNDPNASQLDILVNHQISSDLGTVNTALGAVNNDINTGNTNGIQYQLDVFQAEHAIGVSMLDQQLDINLNV